MRRCCQGDAKEDGMGHGDEVDVMGQRTSEVRGDGCVGGMEKGSQGRGG